VGVSVDDHSSTVTASRRLTNDVRLGPLTESLEKFVVDALLHVNTRTSTAALAVVIKDTEVDPRDSVVDVGVVKDDVGRLATKLKGDLLEVGSSSSLHDLATNDGRTSESDLVDIHVGGNGSTSDLSEPADHIDDTSREASFLDELCGVKT